MNDAELRGVLVLAREKIQHGWVQGTPRAGHKVCAAQAIVEAVHMDTELTCCCPVHAASPEYQQVSDYLLRIIRSRSGRRYPAIPSWNDDGNTTKQEVLATFDEAIRRLDPVETVEPTVEVKVEEPVAAPRVAEKVEFFSIVIPPPAPEQESRWAKVKDLIGV